MSADNGVYILHTKDGYRVAHAQAIDNIIYQPDDSGFNLRQLYFKFERSKVYSKKEAHKKAFEIYEEIMNDDFCPICEYGIQEIDASHIEFPSVEPFCCNKPNFNSDDVCENCGEWK